MVHSPDIFSSNSPICSAMRQAFLYALADQLDYDGWLVVRVQLAAILALACAAMY